MTKEIDFEKIGKPLMTPEQYVKFLEALNEERKAHLRFIYWKNKVEGRK